MALMCSVIAVAGFSQGVNVTSGSINGHVTDSSGGALPGVTVTATNTETGLTRNTVSDNAGAYHFNLLPTGRYRVDAELSGLGKASLAVTVLLGNDTRADLKISPQVTESITVSGVAPVIDTQRTGMAESVTNKQIENLPLLGRDFRSLAALTPGVSAGSFDTASITANGARPLSTDYNIDGASSNNDFFGQQTGGTRAPFTFSQAAIKEFQVIRTQYDAEYGRGVGAVVNAITKSGTNDIDGELFFFDRKKDWASSRPLVVNTNINGTTFPLGINDSFLAKDSTQPGFAIGGPIVHDRLFYFLNADGQKQSQPVVIGPTSDLRTSTQFLALTAAQQAAVLSKIQTAVGAPYETGLAYSQDNKLNTYLIKLDGNLGEKNHVSLRDNITKFNTTNSGATSSFGLNQTNEVDKFYQAAVEGDTVFTNNSFNQFIGQYGRDQRPVTSQFGGTEFSINFGTNQFFGANDTTPNTADEKKYQIKDTLNYQWHNQSIKVGGELLHRDLFDSFPRFAGGMFAFSNVTNFLNNVPATFQQAVGVNNGDVEWNTNLWGLYVNDSFHIGQRLTVDAGVRYDYEKTPRPSGNAFPQHPEFITQIKDDKNNIGPRLGFAYDLFGNGRSVLRGGVGKFFEYMPDILLASPIQGISGALLTTLFTCNATSTNPCPTYPNILSPADFLAKSKLSANLVTIGPDYQAQEAMRTSLQFEQQVGQTYSAGISGVYSKLNHVQGTININVVPTGTLLGNLPIYDYNSSANPARLYNDLGIIREITSNEQAWYRAGTVEFHKLALNDSKLSWDINYTRANSYDFETNTRSTSTTFLIDPRNPSLSEAVSDNDIKDRVVGDLIYRLPLGFEVSAVAFWHSGFPYTAAVSFGGCTPSCSANSLEGQPQTTSTANFTPVWVNSSGQIIDITQANGFTKAQFASFLSAQGGHLIARNSFRQPNVYDADLRLTKRFNLTRGMQLQLIGEMFNVFNKNPKVVTGGNMDLFRISYTAATDKYTITKFTNNVAPSGQPANAQTTFGLVQGYSGEVSPRQMQLAAKLIF